MRFSKGLLLLPLEHYSTEEHSIQYHPIYQLIELYLYISFMYNDNVKRLLLVIY